MVHASDHGLIASSSPMCRLTFVPPLSSTTTVLGAIELEVIVAKSAKAS
jgi:hypothetical protein